MRKNQPEHSVKDPYQKTAQVPTLPIYQAPAFLNSYFTEYSSHELVAHEFYMQQYDISTLNSPNKSEQPPKPKPTLIMVPIIPNKQTPDTFKFTQDPYLIINCHTIMTCTVPCPLILTKTDEKNQSQLIKSYKVQSARRCIYTTAGRLPPSLMNHTQEIWSTSQYSKHTNRPDRSKSKQTEALSATDKQISRLQPPEMKPTLIMVPIILHKQTPDTLKSPQNICLTTNKRHTMIHTDPTHLTHPKTDENNQCKSPTFYKVPILKLFTRWLPSKRQALPCS